MNALASMAHKKIGASKRPNLFIHTNTYLMRTGGMSEGTTGMPTGDSGLAGFTNKSVVPTGGTCRGAVVVKSADEVSLGAAEVP